MGTKKLPDFEAQLDFLLQDDAALLAQPEDDRAIQQAVEDYSRDRPQTKKFDFAGDGVVFDIATPADWIVAVSKVTSIEYPADERDPVYLEAGDWQLYTKVDASQVIRLLATTPQAGKKARVEYTLPQTQPTATLATSAPDPDFFAIADRAAGYAFFALAAKMTQTTDPTLAADSIDRQAAAERYRSLGGSAFKRYDRRLGKDRDETPGAAGATVDLDTELQSGLDRLTHPSRGR